MATQHIYRLAGDVKFDGNTFDISAADGAAKGFMIGGVLVTLTANEMNNVGKVSNYLKNVTASTYTIATAVDAKRMITANRAAGIAFTLPAATGSGATFTVMIATTITSNTTTIAAAGVDKITGFQTIVAAGTTTPNVYPITNTSVLLTMNGTTKGGIQGSMVELVDLAANLWFANETLIGSGVLVANFS